MHSYFYQIKKIGGLNQSIFSEKCINLAKINAKKHSVEVNFQKKDILNIENGIISLII